MSKHEIISKVFTSDTGGNCPVDFVILKNKVAIGITDESICLYGTVSDFEEGLQPIQIYNLYNLDADKINLKIYHDLLDFKFESEDQCDLFYTLFTPFNTSNNIANSMHNFINELELNRVKWLQDLSVINGLVALRSENLNAIETAKQVVYWTLKLYNWAK
jgi:hypothetical protein